MDTIGLLGSWFAFHPHAVKEDRPNKGRDQHKITIVHLILLRSSLSSHLLPLASGVLCFLSCCMTLGFRARTENHQAPSLFTSKRS